MKKVLSILFAGMVALMATACFPEENFATFDASKATAPVVNGYELGDKALTVNYTPGKFNMGFNDKLAVNHILVIVSADGKTVSKPVATSNKDNVLTASVTALSNALVALGYQEDQTASFDMVLRATMQNPAQDNGRNGYVDATGKISISNFVVTFPKGSPYQDYTATSPWSVIGSISAYDMSWNKDLEMWATEDGLLHVAKCVSLKAGEEFKFRKNQDWGVNVGGTYGSLGTPFEVTQDGPNIVAPADGLYDLWLDEAAGSAMLTEAYQAYPDHKDASNWSVIGSLSEYGISWNGDLPMLTDGTTHVAQGIKLTGSDEFKFRQDKDWAVNLGGDFGSLGSDFAVTQDGPNIKGVADGVYDLIVNPGAGTAQIVETLGGGVSGIIGGDNPEPEKPEVWSLIGTLGGTGWDTDFDLSNTTGDIWVIRSVKLTASDEFKIRADHSWDTNVGGPDANDVSIIDPDNPYDVYKPVLGTAFAAGGYNIHVGVEGYYDVTFDYAAQTILIEEHEAVFSLIGQLNGTSWNLDIPMTEENGVWTSPVVSVEGEFKIRFDYSWDADKTYGVADKSFVAVPGEPFTLVQPGENIKLAEAGNYKVIFTPATMEVVVKAVAFPEQLYMIGAEFGGWNWESDGVVEMTPVLHNPDWGAEAEGQFWTVRYFTAGQGFKFNSKRAWGGDFWGLTTNEGFTEEGGNCVVAEDGYYMVHIDLKREIVHVEPARIYGIGSCFGGWNEGMEDALFKADGKTLKATTVAEGEVRLYAASAISTSDWWTREFVFFDGKIAYRGNGGDQERVTVLKGQQITLDFNAGTATVTGEGEQSELPTTMYVIGDAVGGWNWEENGLAMIPVNGHDGCFWVIRYLEPDKGFKFCPVKEWNGDFYSLGENDSGFTVDGGNCYVAEKGLYILGVDFGAKVIKAEPAKVYGIGDCFEQGWDASVPFTQLNEDGSITSPVLKAGDIRMHTACSVFPDAAWWQMEFVFFDGKIAYRGNGGDQERVKMEEGQTVTLDFNAGTATVK